MFTTKSSQSFNESVYCVLVEHERVLSVPGERGIFSRSVCSQCWT